MMKKVEIVLVLPGEADSFLWMCDPTHTDGLTLTNTQKYTPFTFPTFQFGVWITHSQQSAAATRSTGEC